MTSPGALATARINDRRPRIRLASPVNLPGPCTAIRLSPLRVGWMISISPRVTTKNGTTWAPASMRTSPRAIGRVTPDFAIRAICAVVSVGNINASCEASTNGVERASCTMMGSSGELVRHVDEAIAGTHVVLQEVEQCTRNRSRFAVANRLPIPFHDRGDLDRATQQQHLARRPCVGDGDVAHLHTAQQSAALQVCRQFEQTK